MAYSAHDSYLESRILSADPLELIRLLYQAAISSVREARRHLAAGAIAARSRAISKTSDILRELECSLDRERGGEISQRLAQLYDYMQRRLIEANFQQADGPLAEVLSLLSTLAEGWEGIKRSAQPEAASGSAWAPAASAEAAPEYAGHAWSL
jgi:flagellar secretion chaperone FliS